LRGKLGLRPAPRNGSPTAEAVGRYPEKNIGPALETGRGFFMVQADLLTAFASLAQGGLGFALLTKPF
jgi:hypothetical protein